MLTFFSTEILDPEWDQYFCDNVYDGIQRDIARYGSWSPVESVRSHYSNSFEKHSPLVGPKKRTSRRALVVASKQALVAASKQQRNFEDHLRAVTHAALEKEEQARQEEECLRKERLRAQQAKLEQRALAVFNLVWMATGGGRFAKVHPPHIERLSYDSCHEISVNYRIAWGETDELDGSTLIEPTNKFDPSSYVVASDLVVEKDILKGYIWFVNKEHYIGLLRSFGWSSKTMELYVPGIHANKAA